jgi:hypothetical protein
MLPAGFEAAIPTSERPQTHALECAATGKDNQISYQYDSDIQGVNVFSTQQFR